MRFSKEIIGTLLLISILLLVFFWQHFTSREVEKLLENPKVLGVDANSDLPPTWEALLQTIDRSRDLEYNKGQTEPKSLGFRSLFIEAPSSLFEDFGRHNWSSGEISILDYETGEPDLDRVRVQFRGRGNTTWNSSNVTAMRPLRFRLQEAIDVMGNGVARNYILLAAGNETSHFRNWTAFNLAARLSGLNFVPTAELVNVYFNNKYTGVYLLTDERDTAPHRSDIVYNVIPARSEFLLEQDARAEGDEFIDYVVADGRYNIKQPLGAEITAGHGWIVRDLILEFNVVMAEAAHNNDFELFESYVDVDSFIDFYLLNYVLDVKDYGGLSVFFEIKFSDGGQLGSRSKVGAGRRVYMGPVWDFDVIAGSKPEDFDKIEVPSNWLNYALRIDEFNKLFNERAKVFSQILPEVKALAESTLEFNEYDLSQSYTMNYQELRKYNSRSETTLRDDFDALFEWLETRFLWVQENPAQPREAPQYVSVNFRGEDIKVATLRDRIDLIPITGLVLVPFNGVVEWLEDKLVIMEFGDFALRFETGTSTVKIQAGRFDTESIELSNQIQVVNGRNVITTSDLQKVLDLIESTLESE